MIIPVLDEITFMIIIYDFDICNYKAINQSLFVYKEFLLPTESKCDLAKEARYSESNFVVRISSEIN